MKKKCFNHPNRMQIETAQSYLDLQLRNKANLIARKNIEKDIENYKKDAQKIALVLKKTKETLIKFKAKIDSNPNLKIREYNYGRKKGMIEIAKIPTTTQEILETIDAKDDYNSIYEPKGKETIQKQINRFILELKLGTTMLTDMSKIENSIKNLK